MMTIEATIRQYVAENILFSDNGYEHPNDTSFLDEGIIDSLGVLELSIFVEDTYGLRVEREDLTPENFDSVTNLAAYIRRKQVAVLV